MDGLLCMVLTEMLIRAVSSLSLTRRFKMAVMPVLLIPQPRPLALAWRLSRAEPCVATTPDRLPVDGGRRRGVDEGWQALRGETEQARCNRSASRDTRLAGDHLPSSSPAMSPVFELPRLSSLGDAADSSPVMHKPLAFVPE